MIRIFVIIFFLGFIAFPLPEVSSETQVNKESYHFEGLDIKVSRVERESLFGVNIIAKRGQKTILDKTVAVKEHNFGMDNMFSGEWVGDMDGDHNPEIGLWLSHGKGQYAELLLYEINNSKLIKYEFPELTKEQGNGYRGHDYFEPSQSSMNRSWPTYKESDPYCCPTGGMAVLIYGFDGEKVFVESFSTSDSSSKEKPS